MGERVHQSLCDHDWPNLHSVGKPGFEPHEGPYYRAGFVCRHNHEVDIVTACRECLDFDIEHDSSVCFTCVAQGITSSKGNPPGKKFLEAICLNEPGAEQNTYGEQRTAAEWATHSE